MREPHNCGCIINESQRIPKPTTNEPNRTKTRKHRNQYQRQYDHVTTHSMYHDNCGIWWRFSLRTRTLLGVCVCSSRSDRVGRPPRWGGVHFLNFLFSVFAPRRRRCRQMTDNTNTNTKSTNDTQTNQTNRKDQRTTMNNKRK